MIPATTSTGFPPIVAEEDAQVEISEEEMDDEELNEFADKEAVDEMVETAFLGFKAATPPPPMSPPEAENDFFDLSDNPKVPEAEALPTQAEPKPESFLDLGDEHGVPQSRALQQKSDIFPDEAPTKIAIAVMLAPTVVPPPPALTVVPPTSKPPLENKLDSLQIEDYVSAATLIQDFLHSPDAKKYFLQLEKFERTKDIADKPDLAGMVSDFYRKERDSI
jgi:hypothetical protein